MKPIIVPFDVTNNRITLTKEELEKILADAYQSGYDDGSKTTITCPVPPYLNPLVPTVTDKDNNSNIEICWVNCNEQDIESYKQKKVIDESYQKLADTIKDVNNKLNNIKPI